MSQVTINLKTGPVTMDRAKAEAMLAASVKQVDNHNDTIRACVATKAPQSEIDKYRANLAKYAAAVEAFRAALEG